MPYISKITLPSNTTYDIKDAEARQLISDLTSATKFLGVTSTTLEDGDTTNPIVIDDRNVHVNEGDIVIYGTSEFIFDGTNWHLFGDLSNLGSLAYKNSASGTVAVPKTFTTTVTPVAKDVSVTGTTTGSVSLTKAIVDVVSSEPERPADATYKPSGNNSSSSVTGTCAVTAAGTVATTYNATSSGANGNFTPAGTVSAPTISVGTAGSTTTIKNPTSKTVVTDMSVAAPAATTASGELVYCSVTGETLSLQKVVEATGASITTANVDVKTGDATYTASAPTFTGTKIYAHHAFTGSSASGTISGTAAAQTWTGVGVVLSTDVEVGTGASFTGASMTSTGSYTPAAPNASTTVATTENKTVTVQ